MSSPECPGEDAILALAHGGLSAEEADEMQEHLGRCDACLALVATLARDGAAPPAQVATGTRIGRYVVDGILGKGGMGAVYAAHDPELRRRVAIKIVRGGSRAGSADELQSRLLREAQVMAQLRHPNVLAVHDVGEFEAGIFLAMELVEGQTLREWLQARPRSWREIVATFRQAGAGLAAAHRAGVVHRDFKPENVLVDKDGRVLVSDFGLARPAGEAGQGATTTSGGPIDVRLTSTGAVMGTPAYMAPEQHAGEGADARVDVFAYCVALHEALHGERPFPDHTLDELVSAVQSGKMRAPRKPVPAAIQRAVTRGLHPDPDRRYPGMEPLLAALAFDPSRRRRQAALAAGAAALAIAGGVLASRGPRELCRAADKSLAGVWDEARRRKVHDAFEATGLPGAGVAASAVEHTLDAWTASWIAARTDACEDTHVRGEQSAALLDQRMSCLDDRLGDLRALLVHLERPDRTVVEGAADAVHHLRGVAACADARRLGGAGPPPSDPAVLVRWQAARARLSEARAAHEMVSTEKGLALLVDVIAEARAIGDPTLSAEALFLRGRLQEADDPTGAQASFHEADLAAARARNDEVAVSAKSRMAFHLARYQGKTDEALRLTDLAQAELERLGGDPDLELEVLKARGAALMGDEKAIAVLQRAVRIAEEHFGTADATLATMENSLGTAYERVGRAEEGIPHNARAVAISSQVYGPEHSMTLQLRSNFAVILLSAGRLTEAARVSRETLEAQVRAFGPDHRDVGESAETLAQVLVQLGRPDEALVWYERALGVYEKIYEPESPAVLIVLCDLSRAAGEAGRLERQLAAATRAREIADRSFGRDQPELWMARQALADAHRRARRSEAAIALHRQFLDEERRSPALAGWNLALSTRRALARLLNDAGRHQEALALQLSVVAFVQKRDGPGSRWVTLALVDAAETRVALHQLAVARANLSEALRILDSVPEETFTLVRAQAELALARLDGNRALAEKARARLAGRTGDAAELAAQVDRWLAAGH